MINFVKKAFAEGTSIERYNILAAVFLGSLAHMSLWFLYSFVFPMKFESFYLRLFLSILCSVAYSYKYLPQKIRTHYFPIYWHFMVMMALPCHCTFLLLMNDFHPSYLYWEIFCVVTMIIYIPHWFAALTNLFVSLVLAVVAYYIMSPEPYLIGLIHGFDYAPYLLVFSFATFSSMIFSHANRTTWLEKQQKQLTALAGSVAHELRNPLGVINSAQTQINLVSRTVKSENLDKFKDKIQNLAHIIAESVVQANDIINLTLSDVTGKKFSSDQIINIDAKTVINEIVEKFGYENSEQKNIIKIKIDSSNSFNFKANHERFSCIASNLIQNSLYYLKDFANLNITIGTEQKDFLGQKYNVIYFLDNGPGIKTENLNNIFNDFYTEGKNNGTGLGLSFCKRNMKAF